ncbi:MAG: hypothetical protein WAS72_06460 [Saprospiraceae bacterium]
MGFIREPEGVDFVIQTRKWTAKEKAEISKFIADYKAKQVQKKVRATPKHSAKKHTATSKI